MPTELGKAYVQIIPSAEGIRGSIANVLGGEASSAGKKAGSSIASGITGSIASAGKTMAAALTGAIGASTAGVIAFSKTAVDAYANYEQLVGGVETLFGAQGMDIAEYAQSQGKAIQDVAQEWGMLETAQQLVMENAKNAYKTAGMSQNEYMETVTSFAASLKQSTANEVEAAGVADMAIQDMSDNANKMGTSMESIQNAYQGFAKQNYTMLDNLKLGYGGTKTEMERLLEDAGKLSGIEYNIDNLSDVYNAIHVIQTELGVTGTTAKEAMGTISGSGAMVKAAWDNVVISIGRGEGMDEAIDAILDSVFGNGSGGGLLENMLPRIETVLDGISKFIVKAAPIISERVPELIQRIVPTLVQSAFTLAGAFMEALPGAIKSLAGGLIDTLDSVWTDITGQDSNVFDTIRNSFNSITEVIASPEFSRAVEDFKSVLEPAMEAVSTVIEGVTTAFLELFKLLTTEDENGETPIGHFCNFAKEAFETVTEVVSALSSLLKGDFSGAWEHARNAIEHAVNGLVELVESILNPIIQVINNVAEALNGIGDAGGGNRVTLGNGGSYEHTNEDGTHAYYNAATHEWLTYAKAEDTPYLLSSATIFGKTLSGTPMMGGETNPEVIYGRDNLMRDISAAAGSDNLERVFKGYMEQTLNVLTQYLPRLARKGIYLDGDELVGGTRERMSESISRDDRRFDSMQGVVSTYYG